MNDGILNKMKNYFFIMYRLLKNSKCEKSIRMKLKFLFNKINEA